MTIKDLYEKAKNNGMEDAEVTITYECDDDYYGLEEAKFESDDVVFYKREKRIEICFYD